MTGEEFDGGMRRLGLTQFKMAAILGCDRGTIAGRCKAAIVDPQYRYIMLGMLAERAAGDLVAAVGVAGDGRDMAGFQFEAAMKRLGFTRTRLAEILVCDRGTIRHRCQAEKVDVVWRYIMLGMLAERAAGDLVLAVGCDSRNS